MADNDQPLTDRFQREEGLNDVECGHEWTFRHSAIGARDELKRFVTTSGRVELPITGHLITAKPSSRFDGGGLPRIDRSGHSQSQRCVSSISGRPSRWSCRFGRESDFGGDLVSHAGVPTAWVVVSNGVLAGVVGGLAGGLAFGIIMQITGIVLLVAALVGGSTASVGWGVHLAISVLFGLIYIALFRRWLGPVGITIVLGLSYGWFWWVVGGLLIMPTWLGSPELVLSLNVTAWQSLGGHVLYGLVLGAVCALVHHRLNRGRDTASEPPGPGYLPRELAIRRGSHHGRRRLNAF